MTSMYNVPHYKITFKHWKTGALKTIFARDIEGITVNPASERVVVWNITDGVLEDIIRSTIVTMVSIDEVFADNLSECL